ncbi:MAG: nuclear transport factor 2 family protein [Gemmatimonadota bacterium]|nr:nuclear transport factor 2 family protein [Gemmatimonadota bacterium]
MTTATIEKELVDRERQYWQAIRDKDVNAAMELTDDQCVVAGAQGVATIDRAAFAGMLNSPAWTLNEFEFVGDVQVRALTDDVAVVAYKVREDLTVEGKPLTLEAADASTWVRRDGRWLCALHIEAVAGDAFGRDRQPGYKSSER